MKHRSIRLKSLFVILCVARARQQQPSWEKPQSLKYLHLRKQMTIIDNDEISS